MNHTFRFSRLCRLASLVTLTSGALLGATAHAHMGIINLTTGIRAGGQSQFAIAGTRNELQFNVPHGCNKSHVPSLPDGASLDTFKFTITVPSALVTPTLRATPIAQFGVPARVPNGDGSVTFTYTKDNDPNQADDLVYKPVLRIELPAATGTALTKYQFLSVQYCMNGNEPVPMDWGATDSPRLLVFPVKRTGFNQYTLDAKTAPDFAPAGNATIESRLKSYFGDAAVIWVGKSGYSPNAETQKKIEALIAKDSSYSSLPSPGRSLSTADTLWVRY